MNYVRKHFAEVKVFPDNGPEQSDIQSWIEDSGGTCHLYDGNVQTNVKTSTNANWRWRSISIDNCNKSANIGDYIVREGKHFSVYTPTEFNARFVLQDETE